MGKDKSSKILAINKKLNVMNKCIKYIVLSSLALFSSCGSSGSPVDPVGPDPNPSTEKQVMKSVVYSGTDETFANPERGFYTEIEGNLVDAVSEMRLKDLKANGKTLVQLLYYLNDYTNASLPSEGLTKVDMDFGRVRNAGLKAIVRFAYTNVQTGQDAPMDIILGHLDQLKSVLAKNKDVIACVQAGFIGAWGEWYYSSHNLNNADSYKKLLDKWLEVLPSDRCIQVRTPKYKQDYLGLSAPITESHAYDGTAIARIAHHNDAFMSDETNMGTYQDVKADKAYLGVEGLYLPIGGETCLPSPTTAVSNGSSAVSEMQSLHWSFLNDAYDRKVLDKWESDGVMTTIKNKLGYRIQLIKGDYSTKHIPGSDVTVKLTLQNVGFAAMYNPRTLQMVLVSADGRKSYVATLPEDPRAWKPSKSITFEESIALPVDIAEGMYQLYLYLPDAESTLAGNPLYAVRLANKGIWDSATGYNDLKATINVTSSYHLNKSTSNIKFIEK